MSAFVVVIAALAIVVILAVSGVWDPRGPQLDLPPSASPGAAALPSPAPPVEPAPAPAVGAQTPTPDTVPGPAAAPAAVPSAATVAPTASAATAATPPPAPAQTPRESSTARKRGPAAETASSDPRSACAGRTQFALYRCMQTQCALPRWAAHPECARLRKSDRVEPP
jgi:non-specific serine/threonine protein kinase